VVNSPKRPSIPLERLPIDVMLRSVEPFCVLSELGVARVGREMSRVRKPARTIIVRDGAPAEAAYIVLRGRVNLVRSADGTRDIILASLGPGEVFGEAAAIEHSRASTTALSATAVELVRVSGDCLRDLVRSEPQLAMRIMQVMSRRLQDVEAVASDLALCDVEERLRRTLSQLARRQGRPEPSSDGWVLAPVPTQSELARMVGSCRETVSRTLSALAREGHLSSSGRRMFLKDSFMTPGAAPAG
jgi:CRP/FNR family transcriptional regulator